MRALSGLEAIAKDYDALLCDVWGVVHDGARVCASTLDALTRFRRGGGSVLLVSNAPRRGARVRRLLVEKMGASPDAWDDILTSGDASRALIGSGKLGAACFHLGPDRDLSLYDDAGVARVSLEAADFVVCSGVLDYEGGMETIEPLLAQARRRGLPMVCANPDLWVAAGGVLYPCAGLVAQRYEALGGTTLYCGKPHAPIYDTAFDLLTRLRGAAPLRARVLAIGDGADTDIAGGRGYGLATLFVHDAGGIAALADAPAADMAIERLRW